MSLNEIEKPIEYPYQIEMSDKDLSFFIEKITDPPPPNDRLKKEMESLNNTISRMELGGTQAIHNNSPQD